MASIDASLYRYFLRTMTEYRNNEREKKKTSIIIHSAGNLKKNNYREHMNSVYDTRRTKQKENELEIL